MNTLKQWELPNGARVHSKDGKEFIFLKMDGMYAHWKDENGEFSIGNFKEFMKEDGYYQIIK